MNTEAKDKLDLTNPEGDQHCLIALLECYTKLGLLADAHKGRVGFLFSQAATLVEGAISRIQTARNRLAGE